MQSIKYRTALLLGMTCEVCGALFLGEHNCRSPHSVPSWAIQACTTAQDAILFHAVVQQHRTGRALHLNLAVGHGASNMSALVNWHSLACSS